MLIDDFALMEQALLLAQEAADDGEIPVGALVVDRSTGEILGRGRNRREKNHSPTAHAEILAMEEAAAKRGSWRLSGCSLYVTMEPCPMCSGAVIIARIDRIIFGAYDAKAGAVCSVEEMFSLPYNHKPKVTAGLLEERCAALLQAFFTKIRDKS